MVQKERRNFAKKAAMVVVGSTVMGTTAVLAKSDGENVDSFSNGVVVGKSSKREILYKKTKAWEEFYKQAL